MTRHDTCLKALNDYGTYLVYHWEEGALLTAASHGPTEKVRLCAAHLKDDKKKKKNTSNSIYINLENMIERAYVDYILKSLNRYKMVII